MNRITKNILKALFLLLFFSTCKKEELLPYKGSGSIPTDTGIYEIDSSKVHGFCDFTLIPNGSSCWTSQFEVYEDCKYNLYFTRYGNGWTGSDATYSTLLPDGRIVWMFGDTFLGRVTANRSRNGGPFLRNTFMIQDEEEFTTLYEMEGSKPVALLRPDDPDEWYWPLDGTVHGNEFQMMQARMGSVGEPGMWSFAYMGFDLAVFSLPDMELKSITPLFDESISYGAAMMEDGGYTYLYGISQRGFSKLIHVARVAGGNLKDQWEYYNGTSWQNEPINYTIANEGVDQFSVFKDGDKYYLVTQQGFLGAKIFIRESNSPVGPFTNRRTLYCTPEKSGNIITYNAFVHPELSENGELRISYNINSLDFNDIFTNVDFYRPRFIRVDNWK